MLTSAAVPRLLHPLAWWIWAGGLAVVANRTGNPLLLLVLAAVVVLVAEARSEDRERRMTLFLWLAGFVVVIRLLAQIVFGGGATGTTVLFRVPQIPLPEWTGSVRLGGPVTLEELASAFSSGLSVGVMILCLGAATVLAGPRRLLRYVPAGLYELGTTLVVALTYAPQLIDDARSVRSARRLRGRSGTGVREVARVAIPVLSSGLRRSLALAASMESRGYGRPLSGRRGNRRLTATLVLAGLVGITAGLVAMMSAGTSLPVAFGLLVGGAAVAAATVFRPGGIERQDDGGASAGAGTARVAGTARDAGTTRGPRRTLYRPDRWTTVEWAVVGTAAVAVAAVVVDGLLAPAAVNPPTSPLTVPTLPWLAALGVAVAATAARLAPLPPDRFLGGDEVTEDASMTQVGHLIAARRQGRKRSGDHGATKAGSQSSDQRQGTP